jgi:hypothetical protein
MLVSLSSYFELVLNGFDKLFEEVLYHLNGLPIPIHPPQSGF